MKNGILQLRWGYYNLKEELIAICVANTRYEAITYFDEAQLDVTESHHSVRLIEEIQ